MANSLWSLFVEVTGENSNFKTMMAETTTIADKFQSTFDGLDKKLAASVGFTSITAGAVLAELDERLTTQIVEKLDPGKAADILEEMAPDAAADVLADLPKRTFDEVLEEMPGQEAREVRELLEYDSGTAGGMMNPDFAFVGEATTRDEVLVWMRDQDLNLDQLDTVVLLDSAAQFAGTVTVSRLLLADSGQSMADLRMEPLLDLEAAADDEEVFELFDKYNLRTLTIVDEHKHPIGVITVDDVVSRLVKSQ